MQRRARLVILIATASLAVLIAGLWTTARLLEAGLLRSTLQSVISARVDRRVELRGELTLKLLTRRPEVRARDVVIQNPRWAGPGRFAAIDSLHLVFAPTLRHPLKLDALEVHGGTIRAMRDDDGRANWRLRERPRPASRGGGLLPLHHLVLEDLRVELRDARRHLDFTGTLHTAAGREDSSRLRLEAAGTLNERRFSGWLEGDPLREVSRDEPYAFRFASNSSGSELKGTGTLPVPFDLDRVELRFAAKGEDLRDLYYLVGVRLPDTGPYTASGVMERAGDRIEFREIEGRSGESDLRGRYASVSKDGRPRFEAELHSKRVRLADVGARAAGRAKKPDGPARLFPAVEIPLTGLRLRDGRIDYRADQVEAGPVRLRNFVTRLTLTDSRARTERLEATTASGAIRGRASFDASSDTPGASLELVARELDFETLMPPARGAAPVSGPMDGRMKLDSRGRSLRELAAAANGTISLRIGTGTMRASLAELLGVDLRGVGLALGRPDDTVGLRCARTELTLRDGQAETSQWLIDTEPVLVRGEGRIDLRTEALDLQFRGQPKQPRLRLRSPLRIGGTLAEPAPRLEPGHSLAQGGAAVALGAIVAPVAAALAFVDPGRAKDADCAAPIADNGQ